jgi:hypothetical protein
MHTLLDDAQHISAQQHDLARYSNIKFAQEAVFLLKPA